MQTITSTVKMLASRVWASVARITPASPASSDESIHDTALTRSESTPASSTMRGLSTTARIWRPIAVQRKIAPSPSTTRTVRIAAVVKSHATKWVPMWNPASLIPSIGGMLDRCVTGTGCWPVSKILVISGIAMKSPSTDTNFVCQPAVRMARNRMRSSAKPSRGDTIRIATTRPSQRGRPSTSTISTYTAPATNACAANAKLKTPVVL